MPRQIPLSFTQGFVRLLLILALGTALPAKAAPEAQGKIALDLVFTQSGIILRMRPLDYVCSAQTLRMDFLIGHRFKRISTYLWLKGDSQRRGWLGTRLDYELVIPDSPFSAKLQLRLFHALNKRSNHQVYLIPTAYYRPKATGR